MKAIAELQKDKILVEMSKEEFANLMGLYGKFDVKKNHLHKEIPISKVYTQHRRIMSLQCTPEYSTAKARLLEMVEALTPITNLIDMIDVTNIKNHEKK